MPLKFKPFDRFLDVRVYYTDMPHWRQAGCTYFVTYRLADSIPKYILDQWRAEKAEWISHHLQKIVSENNWEIHYESLSPEQRFQFEKEFNRKLNQYLDNGSGSCILRKTEFRDVVVETWDYFDGEQYDLADLVIMPNHLHAIITPRKDYELEKILQSRKRQSARDINRLMKKQGELWQKHSYDHIVRNEKEVYALQKYIRENPAQAKLKESDYYHREFNWDRCFDG